MTGTGGKTMTAGTHPSRPTFTRRAFLRKASHAAGACVWGGLPVSARPEPVPITEFTSRTLAAGEFKAMLHGNRAWLDEHAAKLAQMLVGRDLMDLTLDGERLWEGLHPGKARLYAMGRDPLTGKEIRNKVRGGRHTETGRLFMGCSAVDVALWDLRGKVLKKPCYRMIGEANREHIPVYWRPGEADDLEKSLRKAREACDMGFVSQKWYFDKSAKDGEPGFRKNVELVRRLREALPEAHLMFDNHSIRYYADVDYSVRLCKAIAPYKPFFVEEPLCPEHIDGYARIKGETGIPIAGGEHWYTRWQVEPFLERKCVDFVQSDPLWCGGISEWLKICEMARKHPDVKVLPHSTGPWNVAPHCVASQPEDLAPMVEYNCEHGEKAMGPRVNRKINGVMHLTLPTDPGVTL